MISKILVLILLIAPCYGDSPKEKYKNGWIRKDAEKHFGTGKTRFHIAPLGVVCTLRDWKSPVVSSLYATGWFEAERGNRSFRSRQT